MDVGGNVTYGTGPLIVQKHVWDQLFTVDTIWNIGETGDIYFLNLWNISMMLNESIIQSYWFNVTI